MPDIIIFTFTLIMIQRRIHRTECNTYLIMVEVYFSENIIEGEDELSSWV